MRNEFTAIVEREECLANLREAIALILEHRREESLRSVPPHARRKLVIVR